MLRFRDLLRDAPVIRQQYQDFKLELEASNTGGIGEYLAQKAPFIDGLMASVSSLIFLNPVTGCSSQR